MEPAIRIDELRSRQPFWWVNVAFWVGCALLSWRAGEPGSAIAFAVFAAFSVFMLSYRTSIELDERGICHRSRFGTHRIAWNEIRRVETDGVALVLIGDSKQFPVAPRFWAPGDRAIAQAFLELKLAQIGALRVDNPLASRRMFRNTRVRGEYTGRGSRT